MTTRDELHEYIEDTASDLASALDVRQWDTWLVELMQSLEREAVHKDDAHPAGIELVFERLRDALSDRLSDGRWKV